MHTGLSIHSNVTHVESVESVYRTPQYRAMLLMLEMLNVHIGL